VVPEAQDAVSVLLQPSRAALIIIGCVRMLAVRFDNQLCFEAGEIDDERPEIDLSPELEPAEPAAAKLAPQRRLGRRLSAPERSHTLERF